MLFFGEMKCSCKQFQLSDVTYDGCTYQTNFKEIPFMTHFKIHKK